MQITVSSQPRFPLTLLDYGKNAKNVADLVNRLS